MERVGLFALVSLAWCVSPVVKRRVVDYMSIGPDLPDGSPVRVFVAVFSAVQALVVLLLACPTPMRAYLSRVPAEGWTLILVGAGVAAASSVALVELLRQGNPGLTVVYLNALSSVVGYLLGAFLYGKLSWDGTAGVIMIVAGVSLTTL